MANEISVTISASVDKGNLKSVFSPGSIFYDQTGNGGPSPGSISVGTTEESTTFPELTNSGWLFMRNTDDTNYVEWGFSAGTYGGVLEPNGVACFKATSSATLYMKANTAACIVQVLCHEA